MAKKSTQPELIRVIDSKKRKLEVDYGFNACEVRMEIDEDYSSISLNETEVKKLHKALSKFLALRKELRDNF